MPAENKPDSGLPRPASGRKDLWRNALAGLSGGFVSAMVVHPLDVVNTRLQVLRLRESETKREQERILGAGAYMNTKIPASIHSLTHTHKHTHAYLHKYDNTYACLHFVYVY